MGVTERKYEARCQDCRKTPAEIERADPIRIPTIRLDEATGRHLCNACWALVPQVFGDRNRSTG